MGWVALVLLGCGGGEARSSEPSAGAEAAVEEPEASSVPSRAPDGPAVLSAAIGDLALLARKAEVSLAIEEAEAEAEGECNGYCPEHTPSPLEESDPLDSADRDPAFLADLLGQLREAAVAAGDQEPFVGLAAATAALLEGLSNEDDELSITAVANLANGALDAFSVALASDAAVGDAHICWGGLSIGWDLVMSWTLEAQMTIHETEQHLETQAAMNEESYDDGSEVEEMWGIVTSTDEAVGALLAGLSAGPAEAVAAIDEHLADTRPLDELVRRRSAGVATLQRVRAICTGIESH